MAITTHHGTDTTADAPAAAAPVDLSAGRRHVARSRGVLSGILLIVLGAWAALAPFIGPYFNFALDPRPDDAWHWTSGRGLYELLPGGVAVLAGLVLLVSASRALTVLMAWLAALAGAWLVVAPTLDASFGIGVGGPPEGTNTNKAVALALAFFLATGAAIVLVAGAALGRLSVHSVRDVRAAERRAEAEAAARAEAERAAAERAERQREDAERARLAEQSSEPAGEHQGEHAGDHRGEHLDHQGNHRDGTPPTGAYEQQPGHPRDTAGSAGYSGYRPADQPTQQQPVQQQPVQQQPQQQPVQQPVQQPGPQGYPGQPGQPG